MQDYHFQETDEVAHVENLKQKMFVIRVTRREVHPPYADGRRDKDNKLMLDTKHKIDGIEVYWWAVKDDGNKEYKIQKFHTALLVPWSVALEGKDAVNRWIEEKFKAKNR